MARIARAGRHSRHSCLDWQVQHESEVRREIVQRQFIEHVDRRHVEAQTVPLIGAGRIRETVAQHPVAAFQGGSDASGVVIGPGGEMQQCLGRSVPLLIRVQQYSSDYLRARRATRFAGDRYGISGIFKSLGEAFYLRRLAGAFPAFERDEFSRGHGDQEDPQITFFIAAPMRPTKPS